MNKLLPIVLTLGGCSSLIGQFSRQEFATGVEYKRNATFEVNRQRVDGIGIVPRETKYEIKAEFPEGDFVKVQSCQKTYKLEREGDSAKLTYTPSVLEASRVCPLEFFAIEEKRGRRGYGMILFKQGGYTLPMSLSCDVLELLGEELACQAQAGTTQLARFKEPVVWGTSRAECKATETPLGVEIPTVEGACTYTFIAKGDFNKRAYLYIFGFKKFVVEN